MYVYPWKHSNWQGQAAILATYTCTQGRPTGVARPRAAPRCRRTGRHDGTAYPQGVVCKPAICSPVGGGTAQSQRGAGPISLSYCHLKVYYSICTKTCSTKSISVLLTKKRSERAATGAKRFLSHVLGLKKKSHLMHQVVFHASVMRPPLHFSVIIRCMIRFLLHLNVLKTALSRHWNILITCTLIDHSLLHFRLQ